LLSAFVWEETPERFAYWLAASEGEFEIPKLRLETGKRYLTRDGREARVTGEDFSYGPDSSYRFDGEVEGYGGFSWSASGRFEPIRENPLDLVDEAVDPGEGYRLLEEGETILEGDEEASEEEGCAWTKIWSPGETYLARNWFPVRREIPGPPKPPTYRLLNPGEIIREGDEVWVESLEAWETFWPEVTGKPKAGYPAPPARRQIKSYEDA
jgi:hypothetical protein